VEISHVYLPMEIPWGMKPETLLHRMAGPGCISVSGRHGCWGSKPHLMTLFRELLTPPPMAKWFHPAYDPQNVCPPFIHHHRADRQYVGRNWMPLHGRDHLRCGGVWRRRGPTSRLRWTIAKQWAAEILNEVMLPSNGESRDRIYYVPLECHVWDVG